MTQQIHPDQTHPELARGGQPHVSQPAEHTEPGAAARQPSRMSRRSVLRGAAGAGAVGLAAAAGAGAAVAVTRQPAQATLMPSAKPVTMAPMARTAMAGPLVVYLADTTTGEFDVFGDAGQLRVKNPALVSQLLKNLQLAQQ